MQVVIDNCLRSVLLTAERVAGCFRRRDHFILFFPLARSDHLNEPYAKSAERPCKYVGLWSLNFLSLHISAEKLPFDAGDSSCKKWETGNC